LFIDNYTDYGKADAHVSDEVVCRGFFILEKRGVLCLLSVWELLLVGKNELYFDFDTV
jgi:hypothetical protein